LFFSGGWVDQDCLRIAVRASSGDMEHWEKGEYEIYPHWPEGNVTLNEICVMFVLNNVFVYFSWCIHFFLFCVLFRWPWKEWETWYVHVSHPCSTHVRFLNRYETYRTKLLTFLICCLFLWFHLQLVFPACALLVAILACVDICASVWDSLDCGLIIFRCFTAWQLVWKH
jgi:hypothetical protein